MRIAITIIVALVGALASPASAQENPNVVSCVAQVSLRSVADGAPAAVTFVNRTDGFRSVMWIDYNGVPRQYQDLNPGQEYAQQTFVGHPWMITDGPGNCLEIYMPPDGDSVFEITAPGRNFGDE
ncbi:MAG: hypothetical protein ACRED5_03915 [Propylenella sp.]